MSRPTGIAVQFVVLLAFWLVLSGQYRPLFIGMGVVAAGLVTALTHAFVADNLAGGVPVRRQAPIRLLRLGAYFMWLFQRMIVASVQVAYLALHPRMPLDPCVVRLAVVLRSPAARATLANSITLLPGTFTISIEGDELTVHGLIPASLQDLFSGRMQQKIARVFVDEEQPPPERNWLAPPKGTT